MTRSSYGAHVAVAAAAVVVVAVVVFVVDCRRCCAPLMNMLELVRCPQSLS